MSEDMANLSPQSSPMPPPQAPSPRAPLQQQVPPELIPPPVAQPIMAMHQQNAYSHVPLVQPLPPPPGMVNHMNGLPLAGTSSGMQQATQTFPPHAGGAMGVPPMQAPMQVFPE